MTLKYSDKLTTAAPQIGLDRKMWYADCLRVGNT
jgi:hypothetical protein